MAGGVLGLALTKTILGLVSLLVLVLQLLLDTGETPPENGRTPPGYWRGSDNAAVEAIQHRTVAEIPLPGWSMPAPWRTMIRAMEPPFLSPTLFILYSSLCFG